MKRESPGLSCYLNDMPATFADTPSINKPYQDSALGPKILSGYKKKILFLSWIFKE